MPLIKVVQSWTSENRKLIFGIIIGLIALFLFTKIRSCIETPINVIAPSGTQSIQRGMIDSNLYVSQSVLLAETQQQLRDSYDRLTKEMAKAVGINKPNVVVVTKDSIVYQDIPGKPVYILGRDTSGQIFPITFYHNSDFFTETYTVNSKDSSTINQLGIMGKGHLVIGEKTKFLGRSEIKVGYINDNPHIKVDSMTSMVYRPKRSNITLVVGPTVFYDFKNKVPAFQVGITLGYRIF